MINKIFNNFVHYSYYGLAAGACYFLKNHIITYLNFLNLNKKLNNNTFIVSNYKCDCLRVKDFTISKCLKCKVKNLINFEEIDSVMKMFKQIDTTQQINIIIHTQGGISCHSDAIAYLLSNNNFDIHTYVPEYAQSAGTVMAIAGNKIHCNWYSLFSPIDTQLDYVPSTEVDDELTFSAKHIQNIGNSDDDECIDKLQALDAKDHHREDIYIAKRILKNNPKKEEIVQKLINSKFSHEFNITYNDMKNMNLPVDLEIEDSIREIFYLFKNI